MGEVLAFIVEVFVRIVFEAIFEGIFYGFKKLWLTITGQDQKKRYTIEMQQLAKNKRRQTLDEIRQKRAEEIQRKQEMKRRQ